VADRVTIDLITRDNASGEFVLYLLEDGPWPTGAPDWRPLLLRIQRRILAAVDVAVDGHLSEKYPDARKSDVRVEVDSPGGCPAQLEELIGAVRHFLENDPAYSEAIANSPHVGKLRLVMGKELGRFTPQ